MNGKLSSKAKQRSTYKITSSRSLLARKLEQSQTFNLNMILYPSVDLDIQVRELYSCGEHGDLQQYSRNTYENTLSHIKQSGQLGREFREYKGSRQGHKRAAGHFKSYINPCPAAANESELGFWIGPICVTCICVADDTYVLSGDPRQLQGIVNIVEHFSKRYRVTFGADKTKVTVTGSKQDMQYYEEITAKIYDTTRIYNEKQLLAPNNIRLERIIN